MKPLWKVLLIIFVLAAGGGFYWWKTQSTAKVADAAPGTAVKSEGKAGGKSEGKSGRRGSSGPVNVRVTTVKRQPMPVIIDAVGAVESENSVVVRPQASGPLEAVLFKEGDYVKKGQLLFRIDSRPMQAAVDQARAAVSRDQAQLLQARAQEARLRPLMEKDYITRSEYDVAATQVKALEATATANQAILENALVLLSYGKISAPISGRTGGLTVKAGNLVTAGNAPSPLVVINSTQPILVSLSVPQRFLEDIRQAWNSPDLKVQISRNPGAPPVAEGPLVFMDNTVNQQTGTILFKARVKNEKEELWPGQFVSARIILKIEKDAVVLPESAIQPGQNSPFVYLVRDGKAAMQEIQVARQIGDLVVISKGLSGGEEVIATVPATLADGAAVVVREAGASDGKGDRGGRERGKGNREGKSDASDESRKSEGK